MTTERPVCQRCGHVDTDDDPVWPESYPGWGGYLGPQCCQTNRCLARQRANEAAQTSKEEVIA